MMSSWKQFYSSLQINRFCSFRVVTRKKKFKATQLKKFAKRGVK